MRILAAHATGDLWLWSDADIRVPANAIRSLRVDLAATGAGMLTAPYVVRHDNRPREMLDALFVNVEFYPGVVLLGRMDLIRFGFGSGMLFEAEAFRRKVDWSFLGECLAEDYHLGRLLAPSGLGTARFETSSSPRDWRGAILHYLRWQKTIRWCRPGSYLAQLIVLPVLGWMAMVLVAPTHPAAWGGLLGIVALDGVTALAIFRSLGYPIRGSALSVLPVWSLLRGLTWLACWLPWPIVWRGHLWWTPRRRSVSRPGVVGSKRPASD
jgi:ceramide glucosyltransferase